jgi:hypothetical protein
MANPASAGSVWTELPFMRGPQGAERLRAWARQQSEVKRACAARRERVLAYDWARARLCRVLSLSRAENWNGFVPPARDSDGQINTSSRRRELMDLLRDVAQFDLGEVDSGTDQVDQAGA